MNLEENKTEETPLAKGFFESVKNEFKQSPIASLSGMSASIISGLSLIYALAQSTPDTINTKGTSLVQVSINMGNVFLVIAFFLSTIFFFGFILRKFSKNHEIAVLIISVPVVALINFITVLVIYVAPPRELSPALFDSAGDSVFYGSTFIFLMFFAKPVLADMVKTDNKSSYTAGDGVLFGGIILLVWCGFVASGQNMLLKTFLPDTTQLIKESSRSEASTDHDTVRIQFDSYRLG